MIMKTVMLVGRTECGKTTFCQALNDRERCGQKTQAVEVMGAIIDTPGEYLENRRYYKALLVSSVEAEVIVLIQDCTDTESIFPPSFATMFAEKPVFGVISKIDLGSQELIDRAEEILMQAGADPIFHVNGLTGQGTDEIRRELVCNDNIDPF